MNNWFGGECGRVGYDWCANGDDFIAGSLEAGPGRSQVQEILMYLYKFTLLQGQLETYYGYCAKKID